MPSKQASPREGEGRSVAERMAREIIPKWTNASAANTVAPLMRGEPRGGPSIFNLIEGAFGHSRRDLFLLAQTGAGRGRARGEQAEREHESTRTLLEHGPDFIRTGPRAVEKNEDGSSRTIVNASVVLGSSERESDDPLDRPHAFWAHLKQAGGSPQNPEAQAENCKTRKKKSSLVGLGGS